MSGARVKQNKGTLRSKQFDDVYFDAHDGLAESRYVFLEGNGLPESWAGEQCFTIAETGFGTGLNFLAVWKLFEETASENQKLHFISFEKYPLRAAEIEAALQPWAAAFGARLPRLIARYPAIAPGVHRVNLSGRVTLDLVFDDVNAALPKLRACVNAWFLDGFKPATNPEMWSEIVFENMARFSWAGTSFATFTAAGAVKRGLQAAGFNVRKVRGFGTKRDMLVGEKA